PAAPRGGELSVICRAVSGGAIEPALRVVMGAHLLGCASRPIGGAGTADRHFHGGVEPREMIVASLRVAEPAQRDPTTQKLGVRVFGRAFGEPVMRDELIGD